MERPDLSGLPFIRFLTTPDFPPFNYVAPDETVAGFNIDIARALCGELGLACVVQIRPWDTLATALGETRENAIIAGIAITEQTRRSFDFSNRYLTTPAWFAHRTNGPSFPAKGKDLAARVVGVVTGSAHQRFVEAFYPETQMLAYATPEATFDALKSSLVDLVFADGIALSFWLNGESSGDCCALASGPYLEPAFFGEGMAIAVAPGNDILREAINFALDRIQITGRYEEIYLRHFPIGIF